MSSTEKTPPCPPTGQEPDELIPREEHEAFKARAVAELAVLERNLQVIKKTMETPQVEDHGDYLIARRREWMTDEQWAAIGAALTERGWERAPAADASTAEGDQR